MKITSEAPPLKIQKGTMTREVIVSEIEEPGYTQGAGSLTGDGYDGKRHPYPKRKRTIPGCWFSPDAPTHPAPDGCDTPQYQSPNNNPPDTK